MHWLGSSFLIVRFFSLCAMVCFLGWGCQGDPQPADLPPEASNPAGQDVDPGAPVPEEHEEPSCGNSSIDGTEFCDGADFGGVSCESLGYGAGVLVCASDCMSYDPSGCTPLDGAVEPGGICNCSSECAGDEANPGICVFGVCMQEATGPCEEPASRGECPDGSRCWGMSGTDYKLCFPDCDAHYCAGVCDGEGTCTVATATTRCDGTCSPLCGSPAVDYGESGQGPEIDGRVGAPCEGDSDCSAEAPTCFTEAPGLMNSMVGGYCTVVGCGESGCPSGSRCLGISGTEVSICLDLCSENGDCRQGYSCFSGTNTCFPNGDGGGGFRCETDEGCGAGMLCAHTGQCVEQPVSAPSGVVPLCGVAQGMPVMRSCDGVGQGECDELVQFDPARAHGYWDYEINQEGATGTRSWLRRDMMQLIRYATSYTECLSAGWEHGNHQPLGLGDMSELDGAIPGTATGAPGHPVGSHTNGFDLDIAYFQVGSDDNKLRPVCEFEMDGVDQFHCSGRVDTLDVWRTALFIGKLHDSDYMRVVGVDGKVGPLVVSAIEDLCVGGWLTGSACNGLRLAYDETDDDGGWYYWHHHHLHVSGGDTPDNSWWSLFPDFRQGLPGACHTLETGARGPRGFYETSRRRSSEQ